MFAPGVAHAVVNGSFTVTGGNQQQVGQSTITLTNTQTHETIKPTQSTNGNKKTFGFILPDGSYTLTGSAGGQTFTQTFTTGGASGGTISGGFNTDGGVFEPLHGGGIVTAGGGGTTNGGGVTATGGANGGRRFDPATQNIVEFGGGFGPLINFDNTRTTYRGSFVGSGATFNENGVDVMPDFQLWGNYRPAGWNGIYLGAAVDVAIPTEGAQNNSFTTNNGLDGMISVMPRDAVLTAQARVGMRDPVLPGSLFVQAGVRVEDYRATLRAFSGMFPIDNFAVDTMVVRPTFGIGAKVPLDRAFNAPALRRWDFDTELNFTPGTAPTEMPFGNSFSSAAFQVRENFSLLAKLEYEFECFDP